MAKYLQTPAILKMYPGEDLIKRVLPFLQQHLRITRQHIFDCLLVATMQTHGRRRIYTSNRPHCTPFADIQGLTP